MIKPTQSCKISKKLILISAKKNAANAAKIKRIKQIKRIEKRYKTMQSTASGIGEFLFPMAKMGRTK